jgi:putative copper export protein
MITKEMNRGVAAGTAIGGIAATGLMLGMAQLPQEKRVKAVKGFALLVCAFIAVLCLIGSVGVLIEMPNIPAAEKNFATIAAVVLALPIIAVIYGFKRLFKK